MLPPGAWRKREKGHDLILVHVIDHRREGGGFPRAFATFEHDESASHSGKVTLRAEQPQQGRPALAAGEDFHSALRLLARTGAIEVVPRRQLVLLLSGTNATLFEGAPAESWCHRIPSIFLEVARFALIAVGVGLILAYIWGAHIGGLFTALGVSSIVLGLTLQNSVGQIMSGLLVLWFRRKNWL